MPNHVCAPQNMRLNDNLTSIGLGSKESVTPAISVTLCTSKKISLRNISFKFSSSKKIMIITIKHLIYEENWIQLPLECNEQPKAGLQKRYQQQGQLGTPTTKQIKTLRFGKVINKFNIYIGSQ